MESFDVFVLPDESDRIFACRDGQALVLVADIDGDNPVVAARAFYDCLLSRACETDKFFSIRNLALVRYSTRKDMMSVTRASNTFTVFAYGIEVFTATVKSEKAAVENQRNYERFRARVMARAFVKCAR